MRVAALVAVAWLSGCLELDIDNLTPEELAHFDDETDILDCRKTSDVQHHIMLIIFCQDDGKNR